MKRVNGLSGSRRYVLILITFLGCVALLVLVARSSGTKPQESRQQSDAYAERAERKEKLRTATIAVENRTSSLEVVSVNKEIDKGFIVLALRNGYLRPITGYKFSVGDSIEYIEKLNSKWIEPDGETKQFLPLQVGLDSKGIKILAVIFDDESTDGDPRFVREINDNREGARIQRRRTLSHLKRVINSGDFDLLTALSGLESQLAPLSVDESRDLSADKVAGIGSERYVVLQELNRIRTISAHESGGGIEVKSSVPERSVRDGLKKLMEELSQRR